MTKAPLSWRAVRTERGLLIESSRGGDIWQGAVDGMDVADVQAQFARLKARGCTIVDTEDYQHS